MRKTTRRVSDALPVRLSASPPKIRAQNAEGEVDGDFEASFNPAWMIPDRSGRFCWYKKKQTEGSLTHTLQVNVNGRNDDDHQHFQAGVAEATHVSNPPPSMAEATSCESPSADRLVEQAAQWMKATRGACGEYEPDGDIPLLERDDSFSRMLAQAQLARKRTRESPVPGVSMPSSRPLLPSSYPQHPQPHLPLPRGANDAMREIGPVGQQVPASQPRPLTPVYRTPGDKRGELQAAVTETISTPEVQRRTASETLSPMSDAVVPTAWPPLPPPAELPRPEGRRQPLHVSALRFWTTPTVHIDPDESKEFTERPASEGSLPARFSSLRDGREQAPVDKWAMFDAAVPKMSPSSARRDPPGGQAEPRDGAERVSNAPTSRSKLNEKRVWERPVFGESATAAMPPVLSSPLPQVSPFLPTAKRQSPRNVHRDGTMGCEFPPFSEELLTLPSPLRAPSPTRGHPQHKRARDSLALMSSPRPPPPPPPSPPYKPRDLQSAGWSQERTSTGALFWYNRFTGQLSHRKPEYLPVCQ